MQQIHPLINLIIQKYHPEKVILFGSYARGQASKASDIDVVVIKKTSVPFLKRMREMAILKTEGNITQPADIVVYTPEEYAKLSQRWNPFFHRILAEGKVVYGA